jgi:hypothetical protein
VNIIVGDRHIAKIWDVKPDHTPDYKYDDPILSSYPLLSSTSFDRIKLHGTKWVIAFDKDYFVGMPAILQEEKFPEKTNQVWVLIPRE